MKKGVESVDILAQIFGAVLRELRDKKGLTQEQLGWTVGLHAEHIGKLERGERKPTLNTVFKLAEALDLAPEELVLRVRQRMNK